MAQGLTTICNAKEPSEFIQDWQWVATGTAGYSKLKMLCFENAITNAKRVDKSLASR